MASDRALPPKQALFVEQYLLDLNATQAAERAGYKHPDVQGPRLLGNVRVKTAIDAAIAERARRTELSVDLVVQELMAIAMADPNELIEYRRGACRYCYGQGFRYQETQAERDHRRGQWELDKAVAKGKKLEGRFKTFPELGGIGFDPRRDPLHDCPECHGEGIGESIAKDTRRLSDTARRLYAGVKVTREGLEVRTHDRMGALTLLGRHLGMFKDNLGLTGPNGGPIQQEVLHVDRPPNETREQWLERRERELGRVVTPAGPPD